MKGVDPRLFLTVFGTIFLAEIGDKTQLATLLYASRSQGAAWTVFAAAGAALLAATAVAVLAGSFLARHVDERILSWVAGLAFIGVGVWTIVRA